MQTAGWGHRIILASAAALGIGAAPALRGGMRVLGTI